MSKELFQKDIVPEFKMSEIVADGLQDEETMDGMLGEQEFTRLVGKILDGAVYKSAESGARVEILPETDRTIGLVVYDDSDNIVFKTVVDGDDVGDVIIGDYTGNEGLIYDKSTKSFKIVTSGKDAITVRYGSDILLKHGGDIRFTTVSAPTACTATLVETGTGNLENGDYTYKVTYATENGETELGAASNTVTVDNTHKQVELSNIPTSSSGAVIQRKIYRTKSFIENYYLLTTIDDNTTTTYTDNVVDADLIGDDADYQTNSTFGKVIIDNDAAMALGGSNTFLGQRTGMSNTVGHNNVAVGFRAFLNNTTGYGNTAYGYWALRDNTAGRYNVAIGKNSMLYNTTGRYNVAIGTSVMQFNDSGDQNVAVGRDSLDSNTEGNYNVAVGSTALNSNRTNDCNTAIGAYALLNSNGGYENIAIGHEALYFTDTGYQNTASGVEALYSNTTADLNVATGYRALYNSDTGNANTGIGAWALYSLDGGKVNTALGYATGAGITTGEYNTIIGAQVSGLASDLSNNIILADGQGNQRIRIDSDANIGLNTTSEFGSGKGVVGLMNASLVPSSNPTGGGIIYVDSGALKYRGSGGTVTTLASA